MSDQKSAASKKTTTEICKLARLNRSLARARLINAALLLALGCSLATPNYAYGASDAAAGAAPSSPAPAVDPHAAQNPIANAISIPFQNNTSFDVGPLRETENILLVQPVVPVPLSADWTLVTRWVTPIISAPRVSSATGP